MVHGVMHEIIQFARDNPGWTLLYLLIIAEAISASVVGIFWRRR